MTHRYSDRITKYDWLDAGLNDFYWTAQPAHVRGSIINWLDAWFRRLFLREERPPTILSLWGPNGTGKTLVAKGIAKFHILNLACASLEFLPWAAFVDDQLNGQQMHPNWSAHLLIIDDMDSRRPVPESKSTWLLDKLSGRLKYRAEVLHYPTIITRNRGVIRKFLSTTVTGQTDDNVEQSAETLTSALERHTFTAIEFRKANESIAKLRELAKGQDMWELGFHFLEQKYSPDEETWWTWPRE